MAEHPSARCARLLALADRDPRRAARLVQRAGEHTTAAAPDHAWGQFVGGWVLLRWERAAAAAGYFQAALAMCAGQDDCALHCRFGMLAARQQLGEGATLQVAWDELAGACLERGQLRLAARVRAEQIAQLNVLGRPRAARSLAERSASLVADHGMPADQARFDHVAGVAIAGCGDLDIATARLEHAYASFLALRRPVDAARVQFEQAWVWQRREQFARALAELEQARAVFQRFALPLRLGFCEKDLGTVAAGMGDYAAAIAHALRAHAYFAEVGRRDLMARCDLNLGTVAHYSGLFDLADAAYQRAQIVYAELGDQRLFLICQRNQGMLLAAQGHLHKALHSFDELDQPIQSMGDQLEYAELLLGRAGVLHRLGVAEAAFQCFHTSYQHALALGNTVMAARCVLEEGWARLDRQQWEASAHCFQAATAQMADRPRQQWRALYGLGRIAEQGGDAALALEHYQAAGQIVANLRRKLASEHASSGIFAQAGQLYQDALRLAVQCNALAALLNIIECQRALALQRQMHDPGIPAPAALQARCEQLRSRLRALQQAAAPADQIDATLREYVDALLHARHALPAAGDVPFAPFDLALARQHLGDAYGTDWLVLVPVVLDAALLLIVLSADDLTLTSTPYDAPLRDLIARACQPRYRPATYRDLPAMRGEAAMPWATLRALADRLLPEAVRVRLHPNLRLLIVPGAPLQALPWAALRLGDAWLCERAIIQQIPTLTLQPYDYVCPSAATPALLVGCAHFGGRAPDLPGTAALLDLVQAGWPGTTMRLEAERATRHNLLDLNARGVLAHYRLIHIASHAQLHTARGLLGHIKLSDDDLLVDELLQLRLARGLVVLATCEGAASEALPGDEFLSIGRALLAAGAHDVVACLWPSYDLAMPQIMGHLYRELVGGADAALALTRAQRALLAPGDPSVASPILQTPFIWAAFTVTSVALARLPAAGGTTPAEERLPRP